MDDFTGYVELRSDLTDLILDKTDDPLYYQMDKQFGISLGIHEITLQPNNKSYFVALNLLLVFKMKDGIRKGFELKSDFAVASFSGNLFNKEIKPDAIECIASLFLIMEKIMYNNFYTKYDKYTFKLHDLDFWKKDSILALHRHFEVKPNQ